MDDSSEKSDPQYLFTWFLSVILYILGALLVVGGIIGIAIGYQTGTMLIGVMVAITGLLVFAMANALSLLRDIAVRIVYGSK